MSSARPGDNLILREGEWRDAKIVFTGQGTRAAPITLKAATPGQTVLTGTSTLRVGGEHLVVEGLLFTDPDPTVSDLIQFRLDSKQFARDCRLTNCAVLSKLPTDNARESRWIGLYGSGHRVNHCTFQGKTGKGCTFVVWDNRFSGNALGISAVKGIEASSPNVTPLQPIPRAQVGTAW